MSLCFIANKLVMAREFVMSEQCDVRFSGGLSFGSVCERYFKITFCFSRMSEIRYRSIGGFA